MVYGALCAAPLHFQLLLLILSALNLDMMKVLAAEV